MTPDISVRLNGVSLRAQDHVERNILAFWKNAAMDRQHGGFAGRVSADNRADFTAHKSLIHSSRLVWAFARTLRGFGDEVSAELAAHAYDFFVSHFFDDEYGGLYWSVDAEGVCVNARKQTYGQAFGIYALSEYYMATGERSALEKAMRLFSLVQAHCRDNENGGYWEARGRDWSEIADVRLSDRDLNEKKSNNTHLHMLEALTNLLRASDDGTVRMALLETLDVFMNRVFERGSNHFILFQNEKWESRSDVISYGHEIEAVWLVGEALEVLGDPELKKIYEPDLRAVSHNAITRYLDGKLALCGMFNESAGDMVDRTKIWWVQNEAAVGFLYAYGLTGAEDYLSAALNLWEFCECELIDHEGGEWFETADERGRRGEKVHEWKSCYHNTRMCVEIIERCRRFIR